MDNQDVTHLEIYHRVLEVEAKIDRLDRKTQEVVVAFESAKAAFTVLEWFAKVAKPILWIVGLGAVLATVYERWK